MVEPEPSVLRSSPARRAHWEAIYAARPEDELSWHQGRPGLSLRWIRRYAADRASRIIDAGAGSSRLAPWLWQAGYRNLIALDISRAALDRARAHAEQVGARVTWLVRDLARPCRLGPVDLWHDRAVYHFMVRDRDRTTYLENVRRALVPGGIAVVASFAPDGPSTCSGLPVRRYSGRELAGSFGSGFRLLATRRERHRTPWRAVQPFTYVVLRRTSARAGPPLRAGTGARRRHRR